MNFEKGLKEQCLFSLEQTEGSFHNVKAFYEEDSSSYLQGKGK